MKKKLLAILGISTILLSACNSSAKSIDDAKNLYKDKDYSNYQKATFTKESVPETTGDQTIIADYVDNYKLLSIEGTLLSHIDTSFTPTNVNFNAVADAEANSFKAKYNSEFTYELKDGGVETTFVYSKTITNDQDKANNLAVGYAFSYVTFYNSDGLPTSSVLRFSVVKENSKKEVLAKYLSADCISATWKRVE